MQFLSLIAITAAVSASQVDTTTPKRNLVEVTNIMTQVLHGILNFDAAIINYNGGPQVSQLQGASGTMVGIIKTATLAASNMTNLSVEEAQGFQPLSDKLNVAGDKLLADLNGKNDLFSKACVCEPVFELVTVVGDHVITLMNTVSTKFPQGGKGGKEIEHFTKIFNDMEEKLSKCISATCKITTVLTGSHSNSTGNATQTGVSHPVVTAGSSFLGVSSGALAVVLAAFAF
ncbi:uncharacterized protein BCR38DRAFT_351401 [Pseudomassariella vexata]|uniref:Hydrophobic surface binding protein A-domain-containing protein n=1 Tax=Pseudomassariella vexata TaxID=1141098 RepID=A0A1Y2DKK2_9PEZI|nr:uncharacterized protein BCR38DRAFT_351401 [Pseudomassariella vexata]ORY59656.1 hypothetical protein BCR38DRAFT_351401 [Pseudomassariella vexata]